MTNIDRMLKYGVIYTDYIKKEDEEKKDDDNPEKNAKCLHLDGEKIHF